jgi:hypothetical protein
VKHKWCASEKFISNNEMERFAMVFYIQQKEGAREWDRGETERERA